jgi:hypothetical protein
MICARSDYANVAGMICGARSSLAQVDGARRDLLETMSHRRRGDIVSIYTSFPWPALYAEIWLKICDPIGNRTDLSINLKTQALRQVSRYFSSKTR